jgi:hypothetical protein
MADAPTVNGLRCVSVRLLHPWKGAWIMDAELDPDLVAQVPTSGPAVVVMGGATLLGTVDPRCAGTFVAKGSCRVVGGGGGWDDPVPPLHFHADNGVLSTPVYTATGAIVGEKVVDAVPQILGVDFMRSAGPASRVFGDVDWYIDLAGVTQVSMRPPAASDPSVTLIHWDPMERRAELTADTLVLPGTVLADPRLGTTTPTVRDVVQTFDANGSRVSAWCATATVTRLMAAFVSLVREAARTATLKIYQYRVVSEGVDNRLVLQAVNPTAGMPDTLPLSLWPGMSGDSATLKPSSLVLVHFVEAGNNKPPQPVVLGCDPTSIPVKRVVDATAELDVGPSASLVSIAGGVSTVSLSPALGIFFTALGTWATAVAGALSSAGFPIVAAEAAFQRAITTAANNTPAKKTFAA